tara:strand:- start:2724 stop:3566 length:843 start_codon:yes stop_codon:yes gene_type:complete
MISFKSKKGLGRGLSSLIGEGRVPSSTKANLSDLRRNKYQPRKRFDESSLNELTDSIKSRGIIQPIIVRNSNGDSKYEIIAGERRWLAAQKAGLHEVPIVVIEADDKKALEFGIVENVQRHDLNAIEEAEGYKRLIDEFSYDQEQVAKFIGKSRSHIANSLRLLALPLEVVELVKNNKISPGHAKILVGLENCLLISKKIISKKLSVRQTENLVRAYKTPKRQFANNKDPNIRLLEQSLMEKIGMNVEIKHKKNNKGLIIFSYKELDQLNRVIESIKKGY